MGVLNKTVNVISSISATGIGLAGVYGILFASELVRERLGIVGGLVFLVWYGLNHFGLFDRKKKEVSNGKGRN